MPLNIITKILKYQGVLITNIIIDEQESVLTAQICVEDLFQPCPHCAEKAAVCRKGKRKSHRMVRHLDIWGYKCYLELPEYRFKCRACHSWFTYHYDFVEERSVYTADFKRAVFEASANATFSYLSKKFDIPETTCGHIVKGFLNKTIPGFQESLVQQAADTESLVLSFDDFSIKKGSTYRTGVHDLRNGTYLKAVIGRTVDEMKKNKDLMSMLARLSPVAVVADLAPSYRRFISEVFPDAMIIADRFHVNRLITDSLHALRKRLSKDKTLAPEQKKAIKKSKGLIGKRNENLSLKQQEKLESVLLISEELSDAYDIKESFAYWYDTAGKRTSYDDLLYWLETVRAFNIPEFETALNTIEKRALDISNYHQLRYTNASTEGKNNKVKSIMRRSFGLFNEECYENKIYHECNLEFFEEYYA